MATDTSPTIKTTFLRRASARRGDVSDWRIIIISEYERLVAGAKARRREKEEEEEAQSSEIAIGERPPRGPRVRRIARDNMSCLQRCNAITMLTQPALRGTHKYES